MTAPKKFELPDLSGLPKGPWTLFHKNGVTEVLKNGKAIVKWRGFDGSDFPQQVLAIARAIASIPSMVGENGRMKAEISRMCAEIIRLQKQGEILDEERNRLAQEIDKIANDAAAGRDIHPAITVLTMANHQIAEERDRLRSLNAELDAARKELREGWSAQMRRADKAESLNAELVEMLQRIVAKDDGAIAELLQIGLDLPPESRQLTDEARALITKATLPADETRRGHTEEIDLAELSQGWAHVAAFAELMTPNNWRDMQLHIQRQAEEARVTLEKAKATGGDANG